MTRRGEGNRARLRVATSAAHARAEAAWTAGGAFARPDRYLAWLAAMEAAHARLGGPAARGLADEISLGEERLRLEALRRDLGVFVHPPSAVDDIDAPVEISPCWAWGALYALNGSSLGAASMLKTGAVGAHWPAAYLVEMERYARTGGLRAFFDRLDAAEIDMVEATPGAVAVFEVVAGSAHRGQARRDALDRAPTGEPERLSQTGRPRADAQRLPRTSFS